MDERVLTTLLRRLDELERTSARLRQGTLTGGNPLQVELGDSGMSVSATTPAPGRVTALKTQGNAPLVLGPIAGRVTRNATQSIPDNTNTDIVFNSTAYDYGEVVSGTGGTAPVDGIYEVGIGALFDSNSTGTRFVVITVNGAEAPPRDQRPAVVGAMGLLTSTQVELNAGDDVALRVFQNSGGALNVLANFSVLTMTLIR